MLFMWWNCWIKKDTYVQLWQILTASFLKWFYWLVFLLIIFRWFKFLLTLNIVIKISQFGFLKYTQDFFVQFLKIGLSAFFLWICYISLYILEMIYLLEIYIANIFFLFSDLHFFKKYFFILILFFHSYSDIFSHIDFLKCNEIWFVNIFLYG